MSNQPKYIYGRENPNWDGVSKAIDNDNEEELLDGINSFSSGADDEDVDLYDEANDKVDESLTELTDYISDNNLEDYATFYRDGDSEVDSSDFINEYSYNIDDDNAQEYIDKPLKDINDWTMRIDYSTGNNLVDEANLETIESCYAQSHHGVDINSSKGTIDIPMSILANKNEDISSDENLQKRNAVELIESISGVHNDYIVMNETDYENVKYSKYEEAFDGSTEDSIKEYIGNRAEEAANEYAYENDFSEDSDPERYQKLLDGFIDEAEHRTLESTPFKESVYHRAEERNREEETDYSDTYRLIQSSDYIDLTDEKLSIDVSQYDN